MQTLAKATLRPFTTQTYHFVQRASCPACGSVGARTLFKSAFRAGAVGQFVRDFYRFDPAILDGDYQLDECQECSLIFQRYIGDERLLAELYSEVGPQTVEDVPGFRVDLDDFRNARDAHELTALASFLGKRTLRILDYGTGWGLWPSIAAKLGHSAFGAELATEKTQEATRHGVKIIRDDEIVNHQFDVINLEQVLEHVPEPRQLLESLLPSLEGVLKLSLPNAARAQSIIAAMSAGDASCDLMMPLQPLEHINAFNPLALRRLADRLRLREVRPSLRDRYAFLSGVSLSNPKRFAKAVARPMWWFNNPRNLYVWLVKKREPTT